MQTGGTKWLRIGLLALAPALAAPWLMPSAEASSEAAAEPEGHGEAKGHGEEAEEGGHGGGAGAEPTPEPTPAYELGPNLDGRFDISALRSVKRVAELRYPMDRVEVTLGGFRPRTIQVDAVVEFGSESGMAEIKKIDADARSVLRQLLARYSVEELVDGAIRTQISEQWILQLNLRLQTARVRQVYFANFKIGR